MFRGWMAMAAAILAGFVIGLPWGAVGVALAFSICRVAILVPLLIYATPGTPFRPAQFLALAVPPAAAAIGAAVGLAVFVQSIVIRSSPLADVLLDAAAYGLLYLALWLIMPSGREALFDLVRTAPLLWRRGASPEAGG
jgi:hypothetical protein